MRAARKYGPGVLSIIVSIVVFVIPFCFIILTAVKSRLQASLLDFSWPTSFHLWDNLVQAVSARNFMLVRAFINSTILSVSGVAILVVLSAMVAFVAERRVSKWSGFINILVLSGLIIPSAVVPTIWVLQGLGLFKTMPGLILVEVALQMSFCVLLFRAFISSVPKELDEAALIDGAGSLRLFFQIVFPLLRPVIITVIVVMSVAIFNDFTGPLYFLPGDENATVQLTLFNFKSQFDTSWNLLFMDILLITIPPLVVFLFFNRQIISGMSSGAIKG